MTSPSKTDKAEASTKKGTTRPKKQADSDNAPRDKEKQEKKTAKAEKEKKEAEVRYMC
jgi:chromatin assembly factor 1 subunit A